MQGQARQGEQQAMTINSFPLITKKIAIVWHALCLALVYQNETIKTGIGSFRMGTVHDGKEEPLFCVSKISKDMTAGPIKKTQPKPV